MSDAQFNVVFTVPHPDDLDIVAGGTIARLVNPGYRVGMTHMTDGEPTPRGRLDTQLAEMREASGIPGIHTCGMLGLPARVLTGWCVFHRLQAGATQRYFFSSPSDGRGIKGAIEVTATGPIAGVVKIRPGDREHYLTSASRTRCHVRRLAQR